MEMFRKIWRSLLGKEQKTKKASDSFELRKEKFYANYPVKLVYLPNEGASRSIFDESLNTQENVKARHIVSFADPQEIRVNKSQNNEEAKDDVSILDKSKGDPNV